jgi:capsular polysaccharide biosynthesis protein
MRHLASAVMAAAFMALALAPVAAATGNAYAGVWISTDPYDGSAQMLVVSGGSSPAVTYQDADARTCEVNGSRSTHWVANGHGTIQDEGMAVE